MHLMLCAIQDPLSVLSIGDFLQIICT